MLGGLSPFLVPFVSLFFAPFFSSSRVYIQLHMVYLLHSVTAVVTLSLDEFMILNSEH